MAHWVEACGLDDIDKEDVISFVYDGRYHAIYRSPSGEFFTTDGRCTHERVLLCDGLVMGDVIECPKHNGRFDYRTGAPLGTPVTVGLRTYPTKVVEDRVFVDVEDTGDSSGCESERPVART